eukprot:6181249-Pleurochrysis_carterae.AAC.1
MFKRLSSAVLSESLTPPAHPVALQARSRAACNTQVRGELEGGRQESAFYGRQRVRSRVPKDTTFEYERYGHNAHLAPHSGLGAGYILLASLQIKSRLSAPSKDALRGLSNTLTKREWGRGLREEELLALVEAFRISISQRQDSPGLASLTAVQDDQQLLLRWDLVSVEALILKATIASSASAGEAFNINDVAIVSTGNTCTNFGESRAQLHEAGLCTAADAEEAAGGGSSVSAASVKPFAAASLADIVTKDSLPQRVRIFFAVLHPSD